MEQGRCKEKSENKGERKKGEKEIFPLYFRKRKGL
jgi:hypothetical protein